MTVHSTVAAVTKRVLTRSKPSRNVYLSRLHKAQHQGAQRAALSCTNLAHGFAAFEPSDKLKLRALRVPSVAIVSAYNDMLSAHQPFAAFPAVIREAVRNAGGVAQFAGGVPAMCDGITQGQPGMELSLFSRDTIAMATAVALSHNMFDAAVYLGVCDKIVPGLLIGALHFGHLPAVFIPAGPMQSGLSNPEKSRIRQLYAQGKIDREDLLEAESQSYHAAGTCTFYGTANSNQLLMEVMGLHLPGAAFIHPDTQMRDALTAAAARRAVEISALSALPVPVGQVVDEKSIVNAIVALLATGGSTNHTIHLVAIAKAAGIVIDWDDFDALSTVVPLLARIYPNGDADINAFHAAGGCGFVLRELLDAGLLHDEVTTVMGQGLRAHCAEPLLADDGTLHWRAAALHSASLDILRTVAAPFSVDGGLRVLHGNLGRAVIKVSAVALEHQTVRAPALVFFSQEDFMQAFHDGLLQRDFVAVLMFQGPRANGMPELHAMTPALGSLQDAGFQVALVTDGRMSGASGKVPAAIHVSPEVLDAGPLSRVRDGDMILLDAVIGLLQVEVDATEWDARMPASTDLFENGVSMGRELFALFRANVCNAEQGATSFSLPPLSTQPEPALNLPHADAEPFSDEDTATGE
ncbi:MAG: phosphogluconate dehydratase [Burkholderiaceae bacterium]